jgi:hypothetical protein
MTDTKIVAGGGAKAGRHGVGTLVALMVLMSSGAYAAEVLNPSFEITYPGSPWPRPMPLHWIPDDHPSFNSYCTGPWCTDGVQAVIMYNRSNQFVSPGDYQSFFQDVDLTGVASIEFDVLLAAPPAVPPAGTFAHFKALFLVDDVPLWEEDVVGVYLDQQVDVSGLGGERTIEIRLEAVDQGAFRAAYWTRWDNIRLIEGPTTIPDEVTLDPATLNPRSHGKWITCYIGLEAPYEVGEIDGATVMLDDIPAYMGKQGWATAEGNAENIADYNGDGVAERMVKFDCAAVLAAVEPPEATMTIAGRLASGTPFAGTAVIRVLDKEVKGK